MLNIVTDIWSTLKYLLTSKYMSLNKLQIFKIFIKKVFNEEISFSENKKPCKNKWRIYYLIVEIKCTDLILLEVKK